MKQYGSKPGRSKPRKPGLNITTQRGKQGVTFGKVMMLYRFDKKLRLLLFNEIEKIEVVVRCAIVNFGTEMTGSPFWMTDANNFSNPSKFNRSIQCHVLGFLCQQTH